MASIFAAADIGSNTAHVLVAESDGRTLRRIANQNDWISLGEVVSRTGRIGEEQQQALVNAINSFKVIARTNGAERLYVFATEAVRKADNHEDVQKRIRDFTGIEIEIVSPAREAELSLFGAGLDTPLADVQLLFEVGGGSAQIAHVKRGKLVDDQSFPLGTGALIVKAGLKNPCTPAALKRAEDYIGKTLSTSEIEVESKIAVASGGVVRGLWRALHPDGEKALRPEELDYIIWAACRLTVETLMQRFSVKQKRGATLLPGALVYRALIERHKVRELRISEYGIREGAVLQMAAGAIEGCEV